MSGEVCVSAKVVDDRERERRVRGGRRKGAAENKKQTVKTIYFPLGFFLKETQCILIIILVDLFTIALRTLCGLCTTDPLLAWTTPPLASSFRAAASCCCTAPRAKNKAATMHTLANTETVMKVKS
jgi:hypothetical protein